MQHPAEKSVCNNAVWLDDITLFRFWKITLGFESFSLSERIKHEAVEVWRKTNFHHKAPSPVILIYRGVWNNTWNEISAIEFNEHHPSKDKFKR